VNGSNLVALEYETGVAFLDILLYTCLQEADTVNIDRAAYCVLCGLQYTRPEDKKLHHVSVVCDV
jgi:hypothetical protein